MSDKPELSQTTKKPALRESDWLFNAVTVGTCVYLGGGLVLLFCVPVLAEKIDTYKLNSLGDFLAGVFAPLAFAWLVTAVIIQRKELKASRQQFDDSQDVINQQLTYIKTQNDNAVNDGIRNVKISLYDKRMRIIQELITFGMRDARSHFTVEGMVRLKEIRIQADFLFNQDVQDWFDEVEAAMEKYMSDRRAMGAAAEQQPNLNNLNAERGRIGRFFTNAQLIPLFREYLRLVD